MPPHRDEAAQHAHHRATNDADEDHLAIEEDRLNEVLVDDSVRDPDEEKREQSAKNSFNKPINQERKADEHVRRSDEPHDGDLLRTGEHGHPDRGADDNYGHCSKCDSKRNPRDGRDISQTIELLDPFLAVSDVVDETIGLDAIRHGFHNGWTTHPRSQMNLD